MLTDINGTTINRARFNDTNLRRIYMNGTLVFLIPDGVDPDNPKLRIPISNKFSNKSNSSGAYISIEELLKVYRKHNEAVVEIYIAKGHVVPRIVFGQKNSSLGITSITLLNYGSIQATEEGGYGVKILPGSDIILDNHGTIAGGGGKGGAGGKGGKGHQGATGKTTYTTSSSWVNEKRGASGHKNAYWEGIPNNGVNPCDYVYWDGRSGKHCSGKTGSIPGISGSFTRGPFAARMSSGGFNWNVYDIVRRYKKTTRHSHGGGAGGAGGDGGDGGAGGKGRTFYHAPTGGDDGDPGHGGHPGAGNTGYKGGKGGHGGAGGEWGKVGIKGKRGSQGEGNGALGAYGKVGTKPGHSIEGFNHLKIKNKGTLIGEQIFN